MDFLSATVHHATSEQSYREIDLTLFAPLRYGNGLMLGDRPVGMFGQNTPRAFGHLGFTNIFAWADPAREISVALLTSGKPVVSPHVIRLFLFLFEVNRLPVTVADPPPLPLGASGLPEPPGVIGGPSGPGSGRRDRRCGCRK